MEGQQLIPVPDAIPASWGWFEMLGLVTLLLHFIMMNVILGGSFLIFGFRLPGILNTRGRSAIVSLVGKIPTGFALAVNFGVAPLLFLQVLYGHFFYTSSILMGLYWILIIPLLILAYYGAYIQLYKWDSAPALSRMFSFLTLIILIYISFIFSNAMSLMVRPDAWPQYFTNRGGTLLNWSDATLFPRWLHMVVGSIAVAGLAVSVFWHFSRTDQDNRSRHIETGLKIFGWTTMVQAAIGIWYLLTLPKDTMMLFMGRNPVYTIIMLLGILCGLTAIVTAMRNLFKTTFLMAILTMALMVLMRSFVRTANLSDYFSVSELRVQPQTGNLVLFLLVFAIGMGCVTWMLSMIPKSDEGRTS